MRWGRIAATGCSRRSRWSIRVSPLSALVADDGAFITFDNWHNVGFGKVVAIYAPTGQLVRAWELDGLTPMTRWRRSPARCPRAPGDAPPVHFVEPKEQKRVYVPEALGGSFVFTLATGGVVYTAGTRKDCTHPGS